MGKENKQNRVFIGLLLNTKMMISHVQMSQFRSNLSFRQLVNLIVYVLYHFKRSGLLDGGNIHCVDLTELAIDRLELLATLTTKGKKIWVSDDIICSENEVHHITPPGSKACFPENVDEETLQVRCNDYCEIPMEYAGIGGKGHEYKCKAEYGQCPYAGMCPGYRNILIDNGYFQRILYGDEQVIKALEIRTNGERPFNLIKKREGLETVIVNEKMFKNRSW
jgi:hypothetical protein